MCLGFFATELLSRYLEYFWLYHSPWQHHWDNRGFAGEQLQTHRYTLTYQQKTTTTTTSTKDTNDRLPRNFPSKFPLVRRSLPPRCNRSRLETIFAICVSRLVCPCFSPPPPPSLYSPTPPPSGLVVPVGEHHQHELLEAFPSGSLDQAAEAGLHHPYPAVDLRTIFQGPLLSPVTLKFSHKHAENLSGWTQKSFWQLLISGSCFSPLQQALPYVCLLIAMLFFIYAIIGMQVLFH